MKSHLPLNYYYSYYYLFLVFVTNTCSRVQERIIEQTQNIDSKEKICSIRLDIRASQLKTSLVLLTPCIEIVKHNMYFFISKQTSHSTFSNTVSVVQ